MRREDRCTARKLRGKGKSISEIAVLLGCAKSTASEWVRGIVLTPSQRTRLADKEAKGRAAVVVHPNGARQRWATLRAKIEAEARLEIAVSSPDLLRLAGVLLYWAEGTKSPNAVYFTNSDPEMMKLMLRFLTEACAVPKSKIKAMLTVARADLAEPAERFWLRLTKLPRRNLYRTQIGRSKAGRRERDSLPLGTFRLSVCDVLLASKIRGWRRGLLDHLLGA